MVDKAIEMGLQPVLKAHSVTDFAGVIETKNKWYEARFYGMTGSASGSVQFLASTRSQRMLLLPWRTARRCWAAGRCSRR